MILDILVKGLLVAGGTAFLTVIYYLVVSVSRIGEPAPVSDDDLSALGDSVPHPVKAHGSPVRAEIRCRHINPAVPVRYRSIGYTDCRTQFMVFGGNTSCASGCLGLGSCARVCPIDAIVLRNGTISVTDFCNGCGVCVHSCPKKLIELVPLNAPRNRPCAAHTAVPYGAPPVTGPCEYLLSPETGLSKKDNQAILGDKKRSR